MWSGTVGFTWPAAAAAEAAAFAAAAASVVAEAAAAAPEVLTAAAAAVAAAAAPAAADAATVAGLGNPAGAGGVGGGRTAATVLAAAWVEAVAAGALAMGARVALAAVGASVATGAPCTSWIITILSADRVLFALLVPLCRRSATSGKLKEDVLAIRGQGTEAVAPVLQCILSTARVKVQTSIQDSPAHLLHCSLGGGGCRGATSCGGAGRGSRGHIAL